MEYALLNEDETALPCHLFGGESYSVGIVQFV